MEPTWGPPGSCRPQVGPCWPHEPCYQGYFYVSPNICHLFPYLRCSDCCHVRCRGRSRCIWTTCPIKNTYVNMDLPPTRRVRVLPWYWLIARVQNLCGWVLFFTLTQYVFHKNGSWLSFIYRLFSSTLNRFTGIMMHFDVILLQHKVPSWCRTRVRQSSVLLPSGYSKWRSVLSKAGCLSPVDSFPGLVCCLRLAQWSTLPLVDIFDTLK